MEIYDLPDAWTREDFNITAAFMRSPTGRKLGQRLVNMTFKAQAAACESPDNIEFYAGTARGVSLTVLAFQTHFSPAGGGVTNRPSDTDE